MDDQQRPDPPSPARGPTDAHCEGGGYSAVELPPTRADRRPGGQPPCRAACTRRPRDRAVLPPVGVGRGDRALASADRVGAPSPGSAAAKRTRVPDGGPRAARERRAVDSAPHLEPNFTDATRRRSPALRVRRAGTPRCGGRGRGRGRGASRLRAGRGQRACAPLGPADREFAAHPRGGGGVDLLRGRGQSGGFIPWRGSALDLARTARCLAGADFPSAAALGAGSPDRA